MSHRHYCDFAGHEWECGAGCECCCGLPMEGHDHSDCPVELRVCGEHSEAQRERIAEAMSQQPGPEPIQQWQERPCCRCGCTEAESRIVGFCFWCDHTYSKYNPEIEDLHFAEHCPGAPKELKESARERLVRH